MLSSKMNLFGFLIASNQAIFWQKNIYIIICPVSLFYISLFYIHEIEETRIKMYLFFNLILLISYLY